jgi:hypothetical protein
VAPPLAVAPPLELPVLPVPPAFGLPPLGVLVPPRPPVFIVALPPFSEPALVLGSLASPSFGSSWPQPPLRAAPPKTKTLNNRSIRIVPPVSRATTARAVGYVNPHPSTMVTAATRRRHRYYLNRIVR